MGAYIRVSDVQQANLYVWQGGQWVPWDGSGGGGGGGAVTIADGADVAEGSISDAAWVSGDGTVIALLKAIAGNGPTGAVTIVDGGDVTEGAIADAAVTGDNTGTVNAHLRGLTKINADVWDSINNRLKVYFENTSIAVSPATAASESLSSVAASASSVTVLASNGSRKGAIFFNDSSSAVYIKLGATASTTSFTYKLFAYQTLELPVPIYTGVVDAIWDSATGNMRVTEAT